MLRNLELYVLCNNIKLGMDGELRLKRGMRLNVSEATRALGAWSLDGFDLTRFYHYLSSASSMRLQNIYYINTIGQELRYCC